MLSVQTLVVVSMDHVASIVASVAIVELLWDWKVGYNMYILGVRTPADG